MCRTELSRIRPNQFDFTMRSSFWTIIYQLIWKIRSLSVRMIKYLCFSNLFASFPLFIYQPLPYSSTLELNGFSSVVGGKVNGDDHDIYIADPTVEMGTYDEDIQFNPETIVGLRLAFEVNEMIDLTAQVVAKGGDDFEAVFDWAYVNYQFSDHTKAIIGRYRLPLYYYSDYLDTAYA